VIYLRRIVRLDLLSGARGVKIAAASEACGKTFSTLPVYLVHRILRRDMSSDARNETAFATS
jgi:hypothetical protein